MGHQPGWRSGLASTLAAGSSGWMWGYWRALRVKDGDVEEARGWRAVADDRINLGSTEGKAAWSSSREPSKMLTM